MDDRLRQEVAAWLEFYQELGIEEFFRRPPVPGVALRDSASQNVLAGLQGRRPEDRVSELEEPGRLPAQPLAANLARSVETSGPEARAANDEKRVQEATMVVTRSGSPAQSLNLFEAPPAPRRERETLDEIREDLGDCHRCRLAAGRKTIVFGQGNPRAELVFVGEGPGADEDEQGLPFVGRAGQLLNRMIQLIGMKREEVYICNVVKCRPPGNRTPERDEIEACSPFLLRQIEAIRPRLICCLGAPAARTLLGIREGITKVRGQFFNYGSAKALATVHPAYILRNPREEKILREDFDKIRDFLTSGKKRESPR